ncbi:MAG TPA: hypothetical protein EYG03_06480 [Planctomycetes bacterium]|nr:hypothetical protein [Fuerstiella sp.]HIK91613.1 hypothetical protein [Planctomycetota bacterium]
MQRICYFIGGVVLSAGLASAHPGHGNPATADGIGHYVSSPLHFGPIVVATIVLFVASYVLRRTVTPSKHRNETIHN